MSWQDMGLYWAWRGNTNGYCPPPTTKHIEYKRNQCGQDEAYSVTDICSITGKEFKRILHG